LLLLTCQDHQHWRCPTLRLPRRRSGSGCTASGFAVAGGCRTTAASRARPLACSVETLEALRNPWLVRNAESGRQTGTGEHFGMGCRHYRSKGLRSVTSVHSPSPAHRHGQHCPPERPLPTPPSKLPVPVKTNQSRTKSRTGHSGIQNRYSPHRSKDRHRILLLATLRPSSGMATGIARPREALLLR
jgi:hypothetical protein